MYRERVSGVNGKAEESIATAWPALLRNVLADFGIDLLQLVHDPDGGRSDALATVATDAGQNTYQVEVKGRALTPQIATAISADHRIPVPLLVVAPHVSEEAAGVLRGRHIDYVDAVGNAHLSWPGVLVDVRGRRRPTAAYPPGPPTAGRALTRAGARVTFLLLAAPAAASWPVRDLARAAMVSVGTVSGALTDLADAGYLHDAPRGRALSRAGRLLDRWAEAYTLRLAPSLQLGRFRLPAGHDRAWLTQATAPAGPPSSTTRDAVDPDALVVVGGELGGSLLDPQLRGSGATLWTKDLPRQLLARARAQADPDGDLHVRRRFWDHQLLVQALGEEPAAPPAFPPGSNLVLAPAVLIYADLVTSGDPRLREHADRLRRTDARLVRLDHT
jgi:hypothetical protein